MSRRPNQQALIGIGACIVIFILGYYILEHIILYLIFIYFYLLIIWQTMCFFLAVDNLVFCNMSSKYEEYFAFPSMLTRLL